MSKITIIGFTGSHNTGKTTTLDAIENRGLPLVFVDTHSVSRSAQAYHFPGMNLSEIVTSTESAMFLQDKILSALEARVKMFKHPSYLEERNIVYFASRTPVDFYAYAKVWGGSEEACKTTKYTDWLANYKQRCVDAMRHFDMLVYFPITKIPFVAEKNRGSLDTQILTDSISREMLSVDDLRDLTVCHISTLGVEERVDEILSAVENMGNGK